MIFICLKIFSARIVDVSLGTVRTVLTVKGNKSIASLIAFVEVFIWFLVAKEALINSVDSIFVPISYSLGYACGTLIGTYLSNRFVKGIIALQVITKHNNKDLIEKLRKEGFAISIVELKKEKDGIKKDMLFLEIKQKNLKNITEIITKYDKKAFIIINETKYVQNGLIK